jgi:hypothetical protein
VTALWWNRNVDGPRTHALVIGTSRYEHLPANPGEPSPTDPRRKVFGLGQLKTPATAALLFAEWLRDVYNMPDAPISSIRLLLSPSNFELLEVPGFAHLGEDVLPATRENVERALDNWQLACAESDDNVAILYASGHGIELTKDEGGIVLLEDVSQALGSPLRGSLDVGRVRNGMAGHPMAQRQFYFVDACRVQSGELATFDIQGAGVGLDSPSKGAPRCSPVYFSAAPSSEAYGERGTGTIFVRALIECLEQLGVEHGPDRDGNWFCSTTRLIPALERRVREIAAEHQVEQTTVPGGTPADAVMHVLPRPPELSLRIGVNPDDAAPFCRASLTKANGHPLWHHRPVAPVLIAKVIPGLYRVSVTVEPRQPRYKDIDSWPAAAQPPYPEPVVVDVATP